MNSTTRPRHHVRCLGPIPQVDLPTFEMPPHACDAHAHIIGDGVEAPYVENRSYTPVPAPVRDYLAMLKACGCERGVLVQISVHGTDNRVMLAALAEHPDNLRGVAVIDTDVSDDTLRKMHDLGVRGIRFNLLNAGGVSLDALEPLAERIAPLGWHVQLLMDIRQLPTLSARFARLPVTCVFDHMGATPMAEGIDHPGFRALLYGVEKYGWWSKLSGPYHISTQYHHYDDVTRWAQALLQVGADRMVWGTDWPHVNIQQMPNTGILRNLLPKWAPSATLRRQILVDNPQRLYDFPDEP